MRRVYQDKKIMQHFLQKNNNNHATQYSNIGPFLSTVLKQSMYTSVSCIRHFRYCDVWL